MKFQFFTVVLLLLAIVSFNQDASAKKVNLGPYEVIVKKDPFDPQRGANQVEDDTDLATGEEELKSRYILYGTFVAENTRNAFIKIKKKTGRRPRSKTKKRSNDLKTFGIGDRLGGWIITDITGDGIKLENNGEEIWLKTFDSKKKERRATRPVAFQTPKATTKRPNNANNKRTIHIRNNNRSMPKPPKSQKDNISNSLLNILKQKKIN